MAADPLETRQRSYLSSHGWLTFDRVDLTTVPHSLWMLFGEARSKIEHLKGVPLRPVATAELMRLYLAKGAWATTSIEGNTLSEEEVLARIEGELPLPPSREYLGQEIDNMVAAFNLVAEDLVGGGPMALTPTMIANYNKVVMAGLDLEGDVVPGEIRTGSVGVGPYRAVPAKDAEYLLERLCEWLETGFEPPDGSEELQMVSHIVKAVVAHVYFEWIHPFGDGNGRTGRLMEFQIMASSGVPLPACHLLSNHYNRTRAEYYRRLDEARRLGGDLVPFLGYAIRGLVDGLRDTILRVQAEQMSVMWENHVHQMLPGTSPPAYRMRTLVLELSRQDSPVKRAHLMSFAPAVVEAYRSRTDKTLTRDINQLRRLGLIRLVEKGGYVAARDQMRAFLADRVEN